MRPHMTRTVPNISFGEKGLSRQRRLVGGKQILLLILSAFALCHSPALAAAEAGRKLEFNRDIRPILSENCFQCHGPDKGNRKAKLRLDERDAAIEKEAFKPGHADESEL